MGQPWERKKAEMEKNQEGGRSIYQTVPFYMIICQQSFTDHIWFKRKNGIFAFVNADGGTSATGGVGEDAECKV